MSAFPDSATTSDSWTHPGIQYFSYPGSGGLSSLDHAMERSGYEMTRYADDVVIQCRSREAAETALAHVRAWVEAAGLTLHPQKTRIVDATTHGGFDFLGYHFERGHRWPRAKSLDKIKTTIRAQTRRVSGRS